MFARFYFLTAAFCFTFLSLNASATADTVTTGRLSNTPGDNATKASARTARATKATPRIAAKAMELRVDRLAAARTFSTELVSQLALPAGPLADQVTACVENLLGTNTEDGYLDATADIYSFDLLLARCTAPLQRTLAPILPADAYDRYVALLDSHAVKAK